MKEYKTELSPTRTAPSSAGSWRPGVFERFREFVCFYIITLPIMAREARWREFLEFERRMKE